MQSLRLELRRLAASSLIYGVGGVLQRFMALLLLPFFTRVLSTQDYGVLALLGLLSIALTGLFNLGTGNSVGILYYQEEDRNKRPTIIWSNALLLLCNSLFWIAVLFLFADWVSELVFESREYANLLRLSLVGLALTTVADPFLAYLRMEEQARQYVTLTLLSAVVTGAISAWLVLGLGLGAWGMVLAAVLTQGLMLLLALWVIARHLPLGIDRKLLKPLLRIGFPSVFGLFAFLLIDYADRQMLQRMAGLDQLGVYAVGYSCGMVMLFFVGAFSTAWPPFFMSFVNRREDARQLFGKVLKYYVLGFGVLLMLFFAMARPVTETLLGPAFQNAHVVVGMVAAAYMLKGCYLIFLPGLYFEQKSYIQAGIEWVAAFLNIGLNFLWIPLFGITGAAGATLASYLSLVILSWLSAKRYLTVDYDWNKILLGTACLTLACLGLYQVSKIDSLVLMLLYASAISIAALVLIYVVVLREFERRLLLTAASRLWLA
jgi:O-antigen/teichoic acid export membrane protein